MLFFDDIEEEFKKHVESWKKCSLTYSYDYDIIEDMLRSLHLLYYGSKIKQVRNVTLDCSKFKQQENVENCNLFDTRFVSKISHIFKNSTSIFNHESFGRNMQNVANYMRSIRSVNYLYPSEYINYGDIIQSLIYYDFILKNQITHKDMSPLSYSFDGVDLDLTIESKFKKYLDICISNAICAGNGLAILELVIELHKNIGSFIMSKDCCDYIEKPYFSLDENNSLHADGKDAINFFNIKKKYFWHGTEMPEKYGKINSDQWNAKWIIDEKNLTIRRTLIEGIGYSRMLYQLNAKLIDKWNEYELFKIKGIDVENVLLLKMTCTSTGSFYCIRVPPNKRKAKTAMQWINWDVEQDSFIEET